MTEHPRLRLTLILATTLLASMWLGMNVFSLVHLKNKYVAEAQASFIGGTTPSQARSWLLARGFGVVTTDETWLSQWSIRQPDGAMEITYRVVGLKRADGRTFLFGQHSVALVYSFTKSGMLIRIDGTFDPMTPERYGARLSYQ